MFWCDEEGEESEPRLITFFRGRQVNYAQPIQHNKQWLGRSPVSSSFVLFRPVSVSGTLLQFTSAWPRWLLSC